ncbi:glycosyltransferase family 2 protein [Flavobacterium pectinovorum]|uniref:glycosyltransferase family 2 protein n=1 Tax=Flavobacterium pectinovorum TaxID=29533 RepID=UPI001FAB78EB|nr:glycosyltransferase family 2 protein [Flavobacterium pectinovorum]MCI9843884.1 glycosyltransferase [Flavobacterium pectinovorum]
MNYPKISIVTPNFNGGEYLEQTIQSVLSQNYPNLEYIVIDGGSTDNSIAIIKKYENQLAYWISEPDNGLYEAVQKGFDKSTGEIMAWINSDDLYHPKAFFTVAEIFNLKGVNWLQGVPSTLDEMGRTIAVSKVKRWSKLNYYLGNFHWIQQESVFWRRSLWNISGAKLDTEMKYASDLELWIRFFRHEKLFVTNALLAGFRMRSKNQLSLDYKEAYFKEASDKIKNEVNNVLSNEERKKVERIKKQDDIIHKLHLKLLQRMYDKLFYLKINKKKESVFGYPPMIIFDRIKQEFKITE